jgi:chlorite dismutase
MPEQTPKTLSHFCLFSFTDLYWRLSTEERASFRENWLDGLGSVADNFDIFQIFPASTEADIMVWSALATDENCQAHRFFADFARVTNPQRPLIEARQALWGFTKPSVYTKSRSSQEIDPLAQTRQSYLILYPFVKTVDWYLMSGEARQGMMNEHIRVGKEYPAIKQLLLYSFGLQDQEFVVVYETDDLNLFSDLVYRLRSTEGRRYTERDAPVYTALYHRARETLALWS